MIYFQTATVKCQVTMMKKTGGSLRATPSLLILAPLPTTFTLHNLTIMISTAKRPSLLQNQPLNSFWIWQLRPPQSNLSLAFLAVTFFLNCSVVLHTLVSNGSRNGRAAYLKWGYVGDEPSMFNVYAVLVIRVAEFSHGFNRHRG